MKTRIIQTKFWDDPLIMDAPIEARYLFMYYLTCQQIGLTGIFEISDREVMLKTGLSQKQIDKAKVFLHSNDKVRFFKTWVKVINAQKYNNYGVGEKNQKAYEKEYQTISSFVIQGLEGNNNIIDSSMGVVSDMSDTNHKSETINHKLEIRKEEGFGGKHSTLESIQDFEIEEIASEYHVPSSFILSKIDDIRNYCDSKGKKYHDYLATLRNWVKRDALEIRKEAHGNSKIQFINPT